jgi:O-antigen biosynthesis protein
MVSDVPMQWTRYFRQTRNTLRREGLGGLVNRVRTAAARCMEPTNRQLPVRADDVLAANLSQPRHFRTMPLAPGQNVKLNWIVTPAGRGSGGHTTLYRIVNHLGTKGYANRVYFYNVYGADHDYYARIALDYYGYEGPIGDVSRGMEEAHGVVATSWPTAYPAYNTTCCGKRFYLVQDYEPWFYPVGAVSLLAENTYRMGFHIITIGSSLAPKLRGEFGCTVDTLDFGCDLTKYHRRSDVARSGIVFYARREFARRGYELGMMALELFASRNPAIEIHIYGDSIGSVPFRCVQHGRVTPESLNEIYNRCYAGLTISFTNLSLVPQEMLAAGCIPVVNDTPMVRADLKSPYVRFASCHPHSLANALEAVVRSPNFDQVSRLASASVQTVSWEQCGDQADNLIRRAIYKLQPEARPPNVAAANGRLNTTP